MDLGLSGARVLVAASSKGLGFATARQFSREGARVVINGRHADVLGQAAQAIRAETGGDVFSLVGDVSDADGAEALVSGAVDALGGLDVLVTNAGGPPPGSRPRAARRVAARVRAFGDERRLPDPRRAAIPAPERRAAIRRSPRCRSQPIDNPILPTACGWASSG